LTAAKQLNLQSFWLMDTDVWAGRSISEIDKGPSGLVFSSTNPENSVSPHTSHWTIDSLTDFVSFLHGELYQQHMKVLRGHFDDLQSRGLSGGVCDMTAIAIWLKVKNFMWVNSDEPGPEPQISHGFESDFKNFLHLAISAPRKSIPPNDYFEVRVDGALCKYASLHFQGRTKWIAWILAKRGKVSGPAWYWSFLIWISSVLLRIREKIRAVRAAPRPKVGKKWPKPGLRTSE
jgi:hypothetical protein